ncbi:MAG: zf-HC2 domain-containing protein [Thermoleophilia bacterium]|nr:zf-HC2 domain-containing protein [Thermoleophilia bacterium]MDH4344905.1 zf-HC2 domain-containing protein [Thermoleophilia bacterium]MDH5332353.1 zf-HC2 domain-containing protein [Thermoleophilia bacterium]
MSEHDHHELTCAKVVELVTEYLEGTLDPLDRERFERHLVICPGCETYLSQIRTTISLAGRVTEDDLSVEARDALLAAFRDWSRA